MEKIDQIISKNISQVEEMCIKLETVNPNNGNDKFSNESFRDSLIGKNDEITRAREELDGFKNQLTETVDEVERVMQPLTIMGEIEVKQDPQIMDILRNMQKIEGDLIKLEGQLQPTSTTLIHQAKNIK